jgi:hypothetical protein
MTTISHAVFQQMDLSEPDSWEGTCSHAGRSIAVDLTLEHEGVPPKLVESALRFVDELGAFEAVARSSLLDDVNNADESATRMYISHHLSALPDSSFAEIFGSAQREGIGTADFLSRLSLVRVGLYPESEKSHAVFDYSISTAATDYVLAVSFDGSGRVSKVSMES